MRSVILRRNHHLLGVLLMLLAFGCLGMSMVHAEIHSASLIDEDLSAWHEPHGAWQIVGDTFLKADAPKVLDTKPGTGAAMNGPSGKTCHLFSAFEHGDVEAHFEFMVPEGSNSGVYFQGRYEIQIFDSWGVEAPNHGDCGGVYHRWEGDNKTGHGYEGHPPRVNAARRPGEWQTLDVVFHSPRFNEKGEKTKNAIFRKVLLNGILIHENAEVTGPTRGAAFNDERAKGPVKLQGDHGEVAFRNIRLKPLNEHRFEPGPLPVSVLFTPQLLKYDFDNGRKPFSDIETRIRIASPWELLEIEDGLIAILERPGDIIPAKQYACRILRRIATKRSIPALAALLDNEKLSHMARFALQNIARPEVDVAFRNALDNVSGNLRIGLISSIAERGDAKAIPKLAGLAEHDVAAVARAAISAMGRISDPQVPRVLFRLTLPETLERARDDALLNWADEMLAAGKSTHALRVYRTLMGKDHALLVRIGAYRGLVRSRREKALPELLALLREEEPELRQAAAKFTIEIPGAEATKCIAALIAATEPETRIALLSALAGRGDKTAIPDIIRATKDNDEDVRIMAVRALGVLGDASHVPVFVELAVKGGATGDAAMQSLRLLRGEGVGRSLVRAADYATPTQKLKIIQIMGERGQPIVLPALFDASNDADAAVRAASYKALGDMGREKEVPRMVAMLLSNRSESERRSLELALSSAVVRLPQQEAATASIVEGLARADSEARVHLIAVLGAAGGAEALKAVREELASGDAEMRKAAFRALADWPDNAPLADLHDIAKSDAEQVDRILALRGYIRLIGLPSERSHKETSALYQTAMALAERPEEKKLVLAGMMTVADHDALKFVEQFIDDEAVQKEAKVAHRRISTALGVQVKKIEE